jgi:F0F1-type ATP synthase delta subunit
MISSKNLARALYKISKERVSSEKIVSALLFYLEKHRLLSLLPQTLKHLIGFKKNEKEFNSLEIISGLPIDEEITTEIKKILKTEISSVVKQKIERELIGGFIATYKGFIYDASIKNQLNLIKTKLTE